MRVKRADILHMYIPSLSSGNIGLPSPRLNLVQPKQQAGLSPFVARPDHPQHEKKKGGVQNSSARHSLPLIASVLRSHLTQT